MHGNDLLHIHIFFSYSQLISKIDIFWSNVDDFTVFFLLQNSSDFEMCSLMWDNDIMLNNKLLSVYRSSCMCIMSTQTYCKNLLSMCVAMCVFISCNIYVALGARGLNENGEYGGSDTKAWIKYMLVVTLCIFYFSLQGGGGV